MANKSRPTVRFHGRLECLLAWADVVRETTGVVLGDPIKNDAFTTDELYASDARMTVKQRRLLGPQFRLGWNTRVTYELL